PRSDASHCPVVTTTTVVTPSTPTSSTAPETTTTSSTPSTSTSTTSTTTIAGPPLDHFKCYKTKAGVPFTPQTVDLVDQFGTTRGVAVRPFRFCNPASKNEEGISDPTAHLMCYQLKDAPEAPRREVLVRNQ